MFFLLGPIPKTSEKRSAKGTPKPTWHVQDFLESDAISTDPTKPTNQPTTISVVYATAEKVYPGQEELLT